MGRPTLYDKGVIDSINPKLPRSQLNLSSAIHTIIQIIRYKLGKPAPNIHDMLFFLESKTGSGKSTAFIVELYRNLMGDKRGITGNALAEIESYSKPIPGFDLKAFDFPDDQYTIANRQRSPVSFSRIKRVICCTQPTTLTAKGKAEEIASETFNPDLVLGENVGYSTGRFKMKIEGLKSIMYMTLGSLVMMLATKTTKEVIESFEVCVVDECHKQDTSLITGMLAILEFCKKVAGTPGAPLFVFTSATFDIYRYADYMNTYPFNSALVRGGEAKFERHYLPVPVGDFMQSAVDVAWDVHNKFRQDTPEEADILIFMLGEAECKKVAEKLLLLDVKGELIIGTLDSKAVSRGGRTVELIESASLEEARKEAKRPNAIRRVTVATAVAETGITIRALKHVILCGYTRTTAYSPVYDASALVTKTICRSSETQQAGRVGRLFPGHAYFLYPEEISEQLTDYEYPDTYSSDISKCLLDSLYISIPSTYINNPMGAKKFHSFCTDCVDLQNISSRVENLNCKNLYLNDIVHQSKIDEVNDYLADESMVKFANHPPRLLFNFPRDAYLAARAKLIRLGLYGTVSGYMASKMSVMCVESSRILLSATTYNVSIFDACVIAAVVNNGSKRYIINRFAANKRKVPFYDRRKVMSEVVSEAAIRTNFGDVTKFADILCDDFVEFLIITRLVLKNISKHKNHRALGKTCEKHGIEEKEFVGILAEATDNLEICSKMGIENKCDNVNFKDDLVNSLVRLKSLIHSGLRCHVAKQVKDATYTTSAGLQFTIKTEYKPKKLVYAKTFTRPTQKSPVYETGADLISSMDGWR